MKSNYKHTSENKSKARTIDTVSSGKLQDRYRVTLNNGSKQFHTRPRSKDGTDSMQE